MKHYFHKKYLHRYSQRLFQGFLQTFLYRSFRQLSQQIPALYLDTCSIESCSYQAYCKSSSSSLLGDVSCQILVLLVTFWSLFDLCLVLPSFFCFCLVALWFPFFIVSFWSHFSAKRFLKFLFQDILLLPFSKIWYLFRYVLTNSNLHSGRNITLTAFLYPADPYRINFWIASETHAMPSSAVPWTGVWRACFIASVLLLLMLLPLLLCTTRVSRNHWLWSWSLSPSFVHRELAINCDNNSSILRRSRCTSSTLVSSSVHFGSQGAIQRQTLRHLV